MKVVLDFGPIGSGVRFKLRRWALIFFVCFAIAGLSISAMSYMLSIPEPHNYFIPWAIFFFVTSIGGAAGGFVSFVSFAEAFLKDADNSQDSYRR